MQIEYARKRQQRDKFNQGMVLWSVSHKVTKRVTWFSIDL